MNRFAEFRQYEVSCSVQDAHNPVKSSQKKDFDSSRFLGNS
jgi:hypothetical protein